MSKESRDSGGNKVVTNDKGTESRTYDKHGKCTDIQHNNPRTGESHSHEVSRGGLLGVTGPTAGKRK